MSVLNGGLANARTITTDTEFLDHYIASATTDERHLIQEIAQLRGAVPTFTALAVLIAQIRTAPVYPLPPEHPLNPASRYTTDTVSVAS